MNNTLNASDIIMDLIGWLFGLLVLAIGVVNTFWGNDPQFGVFIFLMAFVYFPPVNAFLKAKTGFSIPRVAKWILGVFIIIASLGVGELFNKVDLMLSSF